MKRSKRQLLRGLATVMLLGAGLASCSQDDMIGKRQGETLPDGEYPLMLTASVDGMQTRSAGKDSWNGDEQIGVRIGTDGDIGCYELNADGTVKEMVTPVYWQDTTSATVTAWYPYYESKIDVDISDQGGGFADFDFLTATAEDADYSSSVALNFKHQMAKVSYTLQGDGVTDEEMQTAVVTIFGDTTATFENGVLAEADQTDGKITPCYSDTLAGAALLVPQDMKDKPFIKVSINDNTFIYTPTTENAGSLKAGYVNTYTITVKANGIEVTADTGEEWTDSGDSENVEVKVLTFKTDLDSAKVGDLITESGKLIDKDDLDILSDAVKKQVVGVVFWTSSETVAEDRETPASLTDDKIMAEAYSGCTHGLAVAVKELTYNNSSYMPWQESVSNVALWQAGQEAYMPTEDGFVSISSGLDDTDNINRIYGYQNTVVLRAYNTENGNTSSVVQPVAALVAFVESNACPAPAGSTGWFLPSVKELHMLCYKDVDNVMMEFGTDTRDIVKTSLSAVGGDDLEDTFYWSSSEFEDFSDGAFNVSFSDGSVSNYYKDDTGRARAVCAF